jgi:hypothetical protein
MAYISGILDTIKDVIGDIGFTPEIAAAVARAEVTPSWENIQAVEEAYRARGSSAPPELMRQLYNRYYEAYAGFPSYYGRYLMTTASNYFPFILGGLFLIMLAGRRR